MASNAADHLTVVRTLVPHKALCAVTSPVANKLRAANAHPGASVPCHSLALVVVPVEEARQAPAVPQARRVLPVVRGALGKRFTAMALVQSRLPVTLVPAPRQQGQQVCAAGFAPGPVSVSYS